METSIYIGLSRLESLRRQMDVVANNIANMNTTGYKGQRMLFQEYLERPDRSTDRLSFTQDYGQLRNLSAGPMQTTSNALDVAIRGEGYFPVETVSGVRYTRAGSFQMNADGELVDRNGLPVLGEGNARIVIPQGAERITIKGDGTMESENGVFATLKVVNFAEQQRMKELGGGLYETDQAEQIVEKPEIVQGMIEGSNVQPIVESTQMMEVLRAYQSTQKILENEHERIRTAIRQLGRTQ